MLLHLPPAYTGLAQYGRLAHPIEGIEVVTMTNLDSFLSPRNPDKVQNIRLIKDSIALGIVEAKNLVGIETLSGKFEITMLDENGWPQKVQFIWALPDENGGERACESEALCAPAA